jgi:hypothetical protein
MRSQADFWYDKAVGSVQEKWQCLFSVHRKWQSSHNFRPVLHVVIPLSQRGVIPSGFVRFYSEFSATWRRLWHEFDVRTRRKMGTSNPNNKTWEFNYCSFLNSNYIVTVWEIKLMRTAPRQHHRSSIIDASHQPYILGHTQDSNKRIIESQYENRWERH